MLDLALSHDNSRFASVGGDKTVFLWDVASGKVVRRWSGHGGRVNCVCFGGEGESVLVSGSYDASVRVWDLRSQSGRAVEVLGEAGDSVADVAVTAGAGAGEILSGSVDGRVRGYDLRKGVVTTDVIGPPVTSLDLTGDGAAVLVGGLDSCVRLMDRGGGGLLRGYKGHVNEELRLRSCLGGGDALVVSGSEDGGVVGWDLVSGEVVGRVGEGVMSVVGWNKGRKGEWASGGQDGRVCVWGVEE